MAKEDTLEFPGIVKELLPSLKTAMRLSHIRQAKCVKTAFVFWQATKYRWK
jgi:hypothetical protein